MDYGSLKEVFPIIGGALAIIGGILTFLNGRLNEAQTPEKREQVIVLLIAISGMLCSFFGAAITISGNILLALPLFGLNTMLETILFLRRSGHIERVKIVMLLASYSSVILLFALGIAAYLNNQALFQMSQLMNIVERLIR